jgi:hypothetical protein
MSRLNYRHLQLERAKFGQPAEVSFVGGDDSDALSTCAECDQCIVGQSSLSDLFVMVFGGQACEHCSRLAPVAQIWNKDSICPVKISLHTFHNPAIAVGSSGVEFFEHNRTEPKG